MNKTCPKCGAEVDVSVKYCPKCGTALLPELEFGTKKEVKYIAAGCGGCLTLLLALIWLIIFLWNIPILGFILATFAAITPCIFYVMAILWLDRHEKEPVYLLAGAFIWGALVSTLISYIMNNINGMILSLFSNNPNILNFLSGILSAPWVEESSKGLALLILFIFMRHEFDNVTDGIIYGSLVGMGFAMTENILYYGRMYAQGGVAAMGVLFYIRSILGGFGHAVYTGTTGAGLGYARQTNKGLAVKIIVPIFAFILAIGEHFMWNFISGLGVSSGNNFVDLFIIPPLKTLMLTMPVFLALLAIAFFALKQEIKVIKEQLVDELKSGVVLPDEYEALTRSGRFRKELDILTKKGIASWYYLRKLYQLEVDLAFRKWHSSRGEKLKGIQRIFSEDAIRAQIASVRAKLV